MDRIIKVSEAAELAVDLPDAKAHLPVYGSQLDASITQYILSAQDIYSEECNISFLSTTWREEGYFPCGPIVTMRGGVTSITSLTYYDLQDQQQTLVEDTDLYVGFQEAGMAILRPVEGNLWPEVNPYRLDAVQLTYVCAPVIRAMDKQAIRLLVSHFHDGNRGAGTTDLPPAFERLCRLRRNATYA